MKKLFYFIYTSLVLIATSGCNKYLDIQPVDRFLEDQVYSKESSLRAALNGIYMNMGKAELYGQNLSATTLDVLAQYYNCSASTHRFNTVSRYLYTDEATQNTFSNVWGNAYEAILNLNLFIKKVSASQGVVSEEDKKILLGEAYGLRAYIAFDMLRLFGPVYSVDPGSKSIPFPTSPDNQITPLLEASTVMEMVLSDLQQAEQYLASDPVISKGVEPITTSNDNFFKLRNRRFNFYAVWGLKARVLLYKNDKPGALEMAQKVIAEGSKFPWSSSALSSPGTSNPDRIFSSEVLFGINHPPMYTSLQAGNFAAILTTNLLVPLPAQLSNVYENYENDYRYRSSWVVDRSSNRTDRTFFKYADIVDKSLAHRFFVPLIRISEMYLIAAEATSDPNLALGYLNQLGTNRGLPALAATVNISEEISKAYQKEFWGEGQTFYFYKRGNKTSIRNGNGNGSIAMDISKYRIPLPISETQYR